ncbi:hypothetical protein CSV86_027990 [Pseudomonas putida CSV86]|uniref:Lipoprotein n=1 Tax=Pseudomonas bharatica CSV86 TaxID=1005395 RepID=A0A7K4EM29_9PSED|nr:hypothetical protein [Pseudomonas bharatica]NNJ18742.1 hypothetical protein [Pseudomonas bharatica CSV86]
MRQVITLLLAASTLGGCSAVGNVLSKSGQVLMNPSIQVGAAHEQLSQVALSLYASPDVNPNPLSLASFAPGEETLAAPLDMEGLGPFAVNLRSANKDELVMHLRALAEHFENERSNVAGALAVRQRLAIPGLVVDEHAPR